jgi:spore coat polysaccharide biosynthesis protein SpsF
MHVAAIIQARMTSTRFPGKVLKPLAGKPVIWHIIHRLLTFKTLERLHLEVGDDPVAKEHVTGYFGKNPNFAISTSVTPEPSCQFNGARMSVDTPADLQFMEELYRLSGAEPGELDIRTAVELLRCNPELLKINSHIYQKKASDTTRQILFRCDADERIGFGHLYRCIALAEDFRQSYGYGITFAVASNKVTKTKLQEEGFAVKDVEKEAHAESLDAVINEVKPDAIIFDCLLDLDKDKIEIWRDSGILTVSIDDPTKKRYHVDLLFYPPVPQVELIDKNSLKGTFYSGWEWVILRKEFSNISKEKNANKEKPVVLVTMGGSDPKNLTQTCIEALFEIAQTLRVEILLGPGYSYHHELENMLAEFPHEYNINSDLSEPVDLFVKADIAIASFGVTAYELAACGTPSILLSVTEDHATSASTFEKAGVAISLLLSDGTYKEQITESLLKLLADEANKYKSKCVSEIIDSNGTNNVTSKIMHHLR